MKIHTNAYVNIAFNTHQQTLTVGSVDEIQSIHTMYHKEIMVGSVHSEERDKRGSRGQKQKTKTTDQVPFIFVMLDNSTHRKLGGVN